MAKKKNKTSKSSNRVALYDTTLRDGGQAEGITFSVADKLKITRALDDFGLDYVEGGWPGSNPKDKEYFEKMKRMRLKNAKLAAFTMTKRKKIKVKDDSILAEVVAAKTPVVTVFGKSWGLHVREALNATPEENLGLIRDTVSYLKDLGKEVIYDAEHFFDGWRESREYALESVSVAEQAGADCVVLCDTNGGFVPYDIAAVFGEVRQALAGPLGIHTHNDSELAVANTIMAVRQGATHVQGTINGYGERCGNANLCSIIPILRFKLGLAVLSDSKLARLTQLSRYVDELTNQMPQDKRAFVGHSAFTHKAGVHTHAVLKNPATYEHVKPERVGNKRRILIGDQAGTSNVEVKARSLGYKLKRKDPKAREVIQRVNQLEKEGYQFEGAEGSFKLLLAKAMGKYKRFFELKGFRVIIENRGEKELFSEATIKVQVRGVEEHTAAEGNGPVDALDNALRKALEKFYPQLREMRLTDFKVRILDSSEGTGARVRVLIESSDGVERWGTVGASENIIEASWEALVDAVEYKLMKSKKK